MPHSSTMDFFGHQEAAHKKTTLLLVYFAAAVITIILGVYLAIAGTLQYNGILDSLLNYQLLAIITSLTLLIVVGGSLYKTFSLRKGGSAVAHMMGAQLVSPATTQEDERRLLNVVEEMAIASGLALPQVYILEEQGINAFAAGYSTDDAIVCVTSGCLEELNREELQGVIAHEFSHILNGDMRLNIKLIGFLHGILLIGLLGLSVLRGTAGSGLLRNRSSSSKNNNRGVVIVIGLLLMVIGYIGVFFGNLIKAAVSRSREFLADAAAVQFTRNPDGIAGALKKIAAASTGSHLKNAHASQLSHAYFSNGMGGALFAALATHPPLAERIRRIQPGGDEVVKRQGPPQPQAAPLSSALAQGFAPGGSTASLSAHSTHTLVNSIGQPNAHHVAYAAAMLDTLPQALKDACSSPRPAMAVIYALLLDLSDSMAQHQLALIANHAGAAMSEQTNAMRPLVQSIAPQARLAVAELACFGSKSMSAKEFELFSTVIEVLVKADNKVSIFELALKHTVLRQLASVFNRNKPGPVAFHSLAQVASPLGVVLSTIAWCGTTDTQQAEKAFAAGQAQLQHAQPLTLIPQERISIKQLEQSLDDLDKCSPALKKSILSASVNVVTADGAVMVEEGELIRALAHAIHCPVPPILFESR